MPQTNILILGNSYQKNMAEDKNLLATFKLKFSIHLWSIDRLVYIIEAGQNWVKELKKFC